MNPQPADNVRGVPLSTTDPLHSQWIVLVRGATTAVALAAKEVVDDAGAATVTGGSTLP